MRSVKFLVCALCIAALTSINYASADFQFLAAQVSPNGTERVLYQSPQYALEIWPAGGYWPGTPFSYEDWNHGIDVNVMLPGWTQAALWITSSGDELITPGLYSNGLVGFYAPSVVSDCQMVPPTGVGVTDVLEIEYTEIEPGNVQVTQAALNAHMLCLDGTEIYIAIRQNTDLPTTQGLRSLAW